MNSGRSGGGVERPNWARSGRLMHFDNYQSYVTSSKKIICNSFGPLRSWSAKSTDYCQVQGGGKMNLRDKIFRGSPLPFIATLVAALLIGIFLGVDAANARVARFFPDFEDGFRWAIFDDIQAGYFLIAGGAALVLIGVAHIVKKDLFATLRRVFVLFLLLGGFWLMAASQKFSFVCSRSDLSLDHYFLHDGGLVLLLGAVFFLGVSLVLYRRINTQ
ncbi:MAG: hypothetical protein ACXWJK_03220 [Burkholderiaceae bacterium]